MSLDFGRFVIRCLPWQVTKEIKSSIFLLFSHPSFSIFLSASSLLHLESMARIPRKWIIGDDCLFHATWQCHNKSWLLKYPWAKRLYYQLLLRFKEKYEIAFFSYAFMDNHIHLSGKLKSLDQLSAFFRVVNSMFAKEINKRIGRFGQVIRDRFKSPCLETERDLIQEMIYHDLNEVRAGKTLHPDNNEFSSYAHYAHGKPDALLTHPEIYVQLGNTPEERQMAYRGMVDEILRTAPRKRDGKYTGHLFIGDPCWVSKKYEILKKLRREQRWTKQHSASPPASITLHD
jgi:putative transposase